MPLSVSQSTPLLKIKTLRGTWGSLLGKLRMYFFRLRFRALCSIIVGSVCIVGTPVFESTGYNTIGRGKQQDVIGLARFPLVTWTELIIGSSVAKNHDVPMRTFGLLQRARVSSGSIFRNPSVVNSRVVQQGGGRLNPLFSIPLKAASEAPAFRLQGSGRDSPQGRLP